MSATLRSNATTAANALGVADWIALVLMIVGAINRGLVNAFGLDLVVTIFGDMTTASRAGVRAGRAGGPVRHQHSLGVAPRDRVR
jgi:hypothetical protein